MSTAEALLNALRGADRTQFSIDDVKGAFTGRDVAPHLIADTGMRGELLTALRGLADRGDVRLSATRTADGLPTQVTLLAQGRPVTRSRAGPDLPPLHPSLASARQRRRTGWSDRDVETLVRVNDWLVDEGGLTAQRVALRERAWRLFGDEKRLDRGRLLREGVLTPEILRADVTPVPFPWVTVGGAPSILFVENSATFDSIVRVLESHPNPVYGIVAFAGGNGFDGRLAFVQRLPTLAHRVPVEHLRYFGDLDRPGLAIPARAAERARELGLPPLEPDPALYRAALEAVPPPRPYCEQHGPLTGWLPPELERPIRALIAEGRRVAQEALDRSALSPLLDRASL